MAGKGKPVSIVINSDYNDKDINRAIKDLQRVKTGAGAATPMMGGLSKAFTGMIAAFGAGVVIGKVVDFLQDAAKAAMEDETSVKKLEVAMRNLNMSGQLPGIEEGIDKLSRQVGVADDQLRPAFQKLAQATGDAETAQSALATALDISAGTGKDLNSVSQALSRAYLGNASALKRLGIPLSDQLVKSKDMTAIQAELNRVFGGQAAAAAGTYAGQMRKLNVAVDEAKEAIGYALLQSIEDMSTALGGTGGATAMIDKLGTELADTVRGVGVAAVAVVNFGNSASELADKLTFGVFGMERFAGAAKMAWMALNPAAIAVDLFNTAGGKANETTEEMADSLRASEGYMQSYIASVDPAIAATLDLANEQEDAADAANALKDAFNAMNLAMAATGSMIAFKQSLLDIRKELKDGKTDITGWGRTSLDNQELILGVFQAAQKAAEDWAKNTGKIDQVGQKYNQFARQARRALIDNGINEKDLDAFLGRNNMWQGKLDEIIVRFQKLPKRARNIGLSIGVELADGTTKGIIVGTPSASQAAIDMIRDAERAARKEAESNSPSKKFARLGKDLVKGTIKGIKDEISARRNDLNSLYQSWYSDQLSQYEEAVSQAQSDRDTYENTIVEPLRDALERAKQTMASFKDSVKDTLKGSISFRDLVATDAEVDADGNQTKAATTFMDNLRAQAAKAVEFANQVKQLVTMGLSEAGITQVLAAGADAGGKIADELITGGVTAITETNALMDAVSTAATTTADTAGATFYQSGVDLATSQLAGAESQLTSFYEAGVANAQAAVNGFTATYGAGSAQYGKYFDAAPTLAGFTAAVGKFDAFKADAQDLIKKKKNDKDKGKGKGKKGRAAGGPVTAGQPFWVGERGPELIVPGFDGAVIPNNRLGGGGVTITVNAGMGADGALIGQQIVEAIKKYERRSGPVFSAA